jgi:hypothetical protein
MDFFGLIKTSDANEIRKERNCICHAIRFQQNFKNWTSDNEDIDTFIQETQINYSVYLIINFTILSILQNMSLVKCIEQIGLMDI